MIKINKNFKKFKKIIIILIIISIFFALFKYKLKKEKEVLNIFWENLEDNENFDSSEEIYLRHIDSKTMSKIDNMINKYGISALSNGLKSNNIYSQYYCINKLVEYYNNDKLRKRSILEIEPFLSSNNASLKNAAIFATDILSKEFNSEYIIKAKDDSKIFTLYNNYSDYGSYNEIWIIKNDELSKLYSFKNNQVYINHPIILSPNKDKIAIQTSSRRSSSFNIIDLNNYNISPELVRLTLKKVSSDTNLNNTHPNGEYSWGDKLIWLDNNRVKFHANLSYDYNQTIESVNVYYNYLNNDLDYKIE